MFFHNFFWKFCCAYSSQISERSAKREPIRFEKGLTNRRTARHRISSADYFSSGAKIFWNKVGDCWIADFMHNVWNSARLSARIPDVLGWKLSNIINIFQWEAHNYQYRKFDSIWRCCFNYVDRKSHTWREHDHQFPADLHNDIFKTGNTSSFETRTQ